jgi:Gas vesicle synthesis protein GvpL/GvpF
MLYLYALTDGATLTAPVTGIGGADVRLEDLGGLSAAVCQVDGAVVEPSERAVLAHAAVVDALTRGGTAVLPVRFGRAFRDRDALEASVRASEPDLRAALELVRGCVEIGLRVLAPERDAGRETPGSGADYMRRRLEKVQEAEAIAAELHAPLERLARASTKSVLPTPRLLLSAAYLVPSRSVERFRDFVDEASAARADLSVACTGPWPPYSFVTAEVA